MADQKSVSLSDEDWQKIISWIANGVTWAQANPLLQKIGMQLQQQGPQPPPSHLPTNGGKERHDVPE